MPKPGPKPTVSTDEIIEVLKNLPEIFERTPQTTESPAYHNTCLVKLTNPVWAKACKSLNNKITCSTLYHAVRKNERKDEKTGLGILDRLKFVRFGEVPAADVPAVIEPHESVEKVEDKYQELHEIAFGMQYYQVIKALAICDFGMIYHLDEQLDLYKDIMKIKGSYAVILCTSGVIDKIRLKNRIIEGINTYNLIAVIEDEPFAVAQAMSEKPGAGYSLDFLTQLMKNNIPPPPEIIVQYDNELISAVSLSMNVIGLKIYISRCINKCIHGSTELPTTVIRVDMLRLLSSMSYFFDQKPSAVENFFKSVLIYLSRIDDFAEFRDAAISVIIVSDSPLQNEVTQTHIDLLKATIDSIKEKIVEVSFTVPSPRILKDFNAEEFFCKSPKIADDFVDDLLQCAQDELNDGTSSSPSTTPNPYYCHGWLNNVFKPLLGQFPLWTQIIAPSKNLIVLDMVRRTSVSFFKDFLELQKSMPVIDYFKRNVTAVQENAQQGRQFILGSKEMPRRESLPKHRSAHLNCQENWMGKIRQVQPGDDTCAQPTVDDDVQIESGPIAENIETENVSLNDETIALVQESRVRQKKPTGRYTAPNPGIYVAPNEIISKRQKNLRNPVILNGKNKTYSFNGKKYILEDTSAFDTLIRIMAHSYQNLSHFRDLCDGEQCTCPGNLCFLRAFRNFAIMRKLPDLYKERGMFLCNYGTTNDLDHVSCNGKLGEFFSVLMRNHYSYIQTVNCSTCGTNRFRHTAYSIRLDDVSDEKEIEDFMNTNYFLTNVCKLCKKPVSEKLVQHMPGSYIALDFDSMDLRKALNGIPVKLSLLNNSYLLTGVVAKDTLDKEETFIPYTYQSISDSWMQQDKKGGRKKTLSKIPIVNISLCLYIILRKKTQVN